MFNESQFTDCYFTKSREAAVAFNHNPTVLYQVFQKHEGVFCGKRAIEELLKDVQEDIAVDEMWCLEDGDPISPFETAMLIKGTFQDLVELETIYLGLMARQSRIASNVRKAVLAANGKPVLFFPARFDHFRTQYTDGYAAACGGAAGCATEEQTDGFNDYYWLRLGYDRGFEPVGTMPHALIAAFGGDTVQAALAFKAARPDEQCWVLVDFHNDCAKTAIEVFKAFQEKGLVLHGVRLDTSEKLADEGIVPKAKEWHVTPPTGVCPQLVAHVRQELNQAGANVVKIAVSGGFTPEKIARFENEKVPADVYAIGEGFLAGSMAYTSDIVAIFKDNRMVPVAKVGRGFKPNPRLKQVVSGTLTSMLADTATAK
jgi:nicotinate phosphoribosyltransferase